MINGRDDLEEFAVSLISLALVRRGYQTQKEVRLNKSLVLDLIARKSSTNEGTEEAFAVEIKWVKSLGQSATIHLTQQRNEISKLTGMPCYMALVEGNGSTVKVDKELKEKMLYSNEELNVTTFEDAAP